MNSVPVYYSHNSSERYRNGYRDPNDESKVVKCPKCGSIGGTKVVEECDGFCAICVTIFVMPLAIFLCCLGKKYWKKQCIIVGIAIMIAPMFHLMSQKVVFVV